MTTLNRILMAAIVCLLIAPVLSNAASVYTFNPRLNNEYTSGTIDSMDIALTPEGLYVQYDVYIYFGPQESYYWNDKDSLEIQYNFTLPMGHFINDSWLWVEDTIVHAKLIDRWTATQIYENLVHRVRRDPSLLSTADGYNYNLNVFPIFMGKERKVKISFKIPAYWTSTTTYTNFQLANIVGGTNTNFPLKLYVYDNDEFQNPKLLYPENSQLSSAYDKYFGNCKILNTTGDKITQIRVQWDSPMKNGVYFNFTRFGDENFYQAAVIPDLLMTNKTPQKVAFCLDYDYSSTNFTLSEILSQARDFLKSNLTDGDSVAVIASTYSDLIKPDGWIAYKTNTIDSIFDYLSSSQILDFSNTLNLLNAVNQFLADKDAAHTSALFWSSGKNLMEITTANKVIDAVRPNMKKGIPYNFMMFNNYNSYYYSSQNNRYYFCNEYLYENLSVISAGSLVKGWEYNSLEDIITQFANESKNSLSFYQVQVNINDGFTYLNYPLKGLPNNICAVTGKFIGESGFQIVTTGFKDNMPFINKIDLSLKDNFDYSSKLSQMWNYGYIQDLLTRTNQNNSTMQEIINTSMKSRVMCIYTAFLALEPWMMNDNETPSSVNDNKNNDWSTAAINEDTDRKISLNAGPNPFSSNTTISVTLETGETTIHDFAILDMMGNVITTLPATMTGNELIAQWNGVDSEGNQVPDGIYIVILKTSFGTRTIKIVLAR